MTFLFPMITLKIQCGQWKSFIIAVPQQFLYVQLKYHEGKFYCSKTASSCIACKVSAKSHGNHNGNFLYKEGRYKDLLHWCFDLERELAKLSYILWVQNEEVEEAKRSASTNPELKLTWLWATYSSLCGFSLYDLCIFGVCWLKPGQLIFFSWVKASWRRRGWEYRSKGLSRRSQMHTSRKNKTPARSRIGGNSMLFRLLQG